MEVLFDRLVEHTRVAATPLACQKAVNTCEGDIGMLLLTMERSGTDLEVLVPPHSANEALNAAVQEQKDLIRWQVDVDDIEERERTALGKTDKKVALCPRCGGKLLYKSTQMRGLDEPATVFRICLACPFRDSD